MMNVLMDTANTGRMKGAGVSRNKEQQPRQEGKKKKHKNGRYQENPDWSDYGENRERVCEIYDKDPKKVSCHHIVFRSDAKTNPLFEDFDINQPSNLYPFSNDEVAEELHTGKQDHDDLHQEIGKKEWERKKKKSRW